MINRLKKLRLKNELTLKKLSEQVGIPSSTLSRYETGSRVLIGVNLHKIANYFDVSVDYLHGIDIETPSVTLKHDAPFLVFYKGKKYKVIKDE